MQSALYEDYLINMEANSGLKASFRNCSPEMIVLLALTLLTSVNFMRTM